MQQQVSLEKSYRHPNRTSGLSAVHEKSVFTLKSALDRIILRREDGDLNGTAEGDSVPCEAIT
jgi:hypothetical protein